MTFMNDLEKKLNNEKQLTENGAVGYRTSGKELLDLNFAVSSMRNWDENEICKAYIKAYYENPLLAVKWLFYLRDIRGNGMGERRAFRICFKWLVENHFDNVMALVELIPEYGRYDDWMCLLDSKAGEVVSVQIKKQLETDICNMEQGREISLLAKWLPSCNASSSKTKQYAKIVCNMLGLKESEYRKTLSTLRAYLNVVEVKMSAGEWEDINYSNLPSRANLLYGNAFLRNDEERRRAFLSKLSRGDVTINASTLFPSDIVHKYYQASSKRRCELGNFDDTLEGLWNSLPNFIEGDNSTLVVRDGSGSMDTTVGNTNVTALEVSTALAIYFSEHLTGHFYNKFITFSSRPAMIDQYNTFRCLTRRLVPVDVQNLARKILTWSLQVSIQVNNEKYLFAHAMTSAPECTEDKYYYLMGNEMNAEYLHNGIEGYISICGHRNTANHKIWKNEKGNLIMCDCGCGFRNGKLGCLCLETKEEFYI